MVGLELGLGLGFGLGLGSVLGSELGPPPPVIRMLTLLFINSNAMRISSVKNNVRVRLQLGLGLGLENSNSSVSLTPSHSLKRSTSSISTL